MAKSARASTVKRNNAKLRSKIFGPAIDARTERLSAKLQELANAPKPDEEKKMDVDDTKPADVEAETANMDDDGKGSVYTGLRTTLTIATDDEDMQWNGVTSTHKPKQTKASKRLNRIAKRKPRNQVVFPSEMARKKRQARAIKG